MLTIVKLTGKGKQLYELTKNANPSALYIIHEVALNRIEREKYLNYWPIWESIFISPQSWVDYGGESR